MLIIRLYFVFCHHRLAKLGPTTPTTARQGWAWRRLLWDLYALQMRPCAGQSELWHRYFGLWSLGFFLVKQWHCQTFKILLFFSFFLSNSSSSSPSPHRLKATIHLSMCWRVSEVQVANMPVLLLEPWGWRLSSYISKGGMGCVSILCARVRGSKIDVFSFGCNITDTAACYQRTVWL